MELLGEMIVAYIFGVIALMIGFAPILMILLAETRDNEE